MKYYIDTCIWIDYWENRSDNIRPLGEFAFNFLNNLDDDLIFYSKITIEELRRKYSDTEVNKIFNIVGDRLRFIEIVEKDFYESRIFISSGLAHKGDALHVAIARRTGAILITRDKDLLNSGLVKANRPEELL